MPSSDRLQKPARECYSWRSTENPMSPIKTTGFPQTGSFTEGLLLTVSEAALTGIPVVCIDVGPTSCVVTDGKTGVPYSQDRSLLRQNNFFFQNMHRTPRSRLAIGSVDEWLLRCRVLPHGRMYISSGRQQRCKVRYRYLLSLC